MEKIKISIAEDFSIAPGPRSIEEGENSGEKFRLEILEPKFVKALKEDSMIEIDLDGTFGYASSFLEEIFGGLARSYLGKGIDIMDCLEIISKEEPYLLDSIKGYIKDVKCK